MPTVKSLLKPGIVAGEIVACELEDGNYGPQIKVKFQSGSETVTAWYKVPQETDSVFEGDMNKFIGTWSRSMQIFEEILQQFGKSCNDANVVAESAIDHARNIANAVTEATKGKTGYTALEYNEKGWLRLPKKFSEAPLFSLTSEFKVNFTAAKKSPSANENADVTTLV